MKKVTIDGKEYEVPDEANWVARDQNGRTWWYENEPVTLYDCFDSNGGKYGRIKDQLDGWKNSKRRI